MGVLVSYSGRAQGTEAVARRVADGLRENGVDAVALDVEDVDDLGRFRAVVVVGARRRGRWPRPVRRFLGAQRAELRRRPVWLVSAEHQWRRPGGTGNGVPFRHVCNLLASVGAEGHARFEPGADGEDDARVASWSRDVASFLLLQAPVPGGGWAFDGRAHVEELDRSTCMDRLRMGREGRLAALVGGQAVSVSVRYHVVGERIVLTPPPHVDLLRNRVRPVSLEVTGHEGGRWYVVVSGWLEPLADDAVELVVGRMSGRRRRPVRAERALRTSRPTVGGTVSVLPRRSA